MKNNTEAAVQFGKIFKKKKSKGVQFEKKNNTERGSSPSGEAPTNIRKRVRAEEEFRNCRGEGEKHRITFFLGFFTGCTIALTVALIILTHTRNILKSEGRTRYMQNIFPLYSLFGLQARCRSSEV